MMYGKYSCNELKILFQRVVSVVPTLGTDNTNGWYKEYQSVVQGIPTVGTESTAPGNILRPAGLCLLRQYLVSVFGNKDHAFPLGGRQAVVCAYCPAVGFVNENIVSAHVDHRFDREDHARNEKHSRTPSSHVFHFRDLVEFQPDSVSAQFADDRIAVLFGVALNRMAYVADEAERPGGLHADAEAFARHFDQSPPLGRDVADQKHARGVGIVSVENRRYVDIDDVAVAENLPLARDAVADHVVHGRADAFGEVFVVQRSRDRSVRGRVVVDGPVDLGGRHARADHRGHAVENARVDRSAAADALDLLGRLDELPAGNEAAPTGHFEDPAVQFGRLPVDLPAAAVFSVGHRFAVFVVAAACPGFARGTVFPVLQRQAVAIQKYGFFRCDGCRPAVFRSSVAAIAIRFPSARAEAFSVRRARFGGPPGISGGPGRQISPKCRSARPTPSSSTLAVT